MNPKMSANRGSIASNLASFIYAMLRCVLLSWIFTFQDFYFCFGTVILTLTRLLLHVSKGCRGLSGIFYANCKIPTSESCFEQKIISPTDAPSVSLEDIEIVFETLGLDRDDRKGYGRHKMARQGPKVEIASVFDKVQPCLDEVKEAFSIFDGNNDGFIDANDLEKVMNSMGFMRFSKEDYQRMIMAFDYNGDGKIDFGEFVKLMGDCFY